MKHYGIFLLILLSIIALLILGNAIYIFNTYLLFKIAISELSFIILYTLVDKSNYKYGFKFTFIITLLIAILYLPYFNWLFYSTYVQYYSVTISILGVLFNSIVLKQLLNKGIRLLLSSKLSTFITSIVEIITFGYLLEIGFKGMLLTAIFRILYIAIIPKIILK